jgi:hypothetical protein
VVEFLARLSAGRHKAHRQSPIDNRNRQSQSTIAIANRQSTIKKSAITIHQPPIENGTLLELNLPEV